MRSLAAPSPHESRSFLPSCLLLAFPILRAWLVRRAAISMRSLSELVISELCSIPSAFDRLAEAVMARLSWTILAIPASFAVLGGVVAQDRSALRVPDGLAFAEIDGYENWPVVAVSHTENGIKSIVAN